LIAVSQGRLTGGRPVVQASSDSRTIDLGELEPDKEARHTFTLTNTTASTLEILGVHTSCGCELAAVRVGEQIGPGKSLPIVYALSNRGGGLRRGTLTIDTSADDPDLKQIVYSLSAAIPRQIWTDPETIEFHTGHGSVPPEPISLVVFTADPAIAASACRVSTSRQLASAEPVAPAMPPIGGESEKEPGSEPGRLSFLVRLKENPPVGMTMDYLTLEFEDRPEATLNVPVIAAVDTAASVLMSSPDSATSSPAPIPVPLSAPAAPLALPKEIE
ncbi:MAG: DUF1573 domain-containing protein, partial [Verrucomicrobiota bacterium]